MAKFKKMLYFTLLKIAYFQASGCRCGWKPRLRGTHVATWRSLLQKTQFLQARSIANSPGSYCDLDRFKDFVRVP